MKTDTSAIRLVIIDPIVAACARLSAYVLAPFRDGREYVLVSRSGRARHTDARRNEGSCSLLSIGE